MRSSCFLLLAAVCGSALAGCSSPSEPEPQPDREVLFQVSTLDALLAGQYDGLMTFRDVKTYGDFGLGTFEALDGEMITLDDIKDWRVALPTDSPTTASE